MNGFLVIPLISYKCIKIEYSGNDYNTFIIREL